MEADSEALGASTRTSLSFCPGDFVVLHGLKSAEGAKLNGLRGCVLAMDGDASCSAERGAAAGRVPVRVQNVDVDGSSSSAHVRSIKPENLRLACPPGTEVRDTEEYGRALFATKDFKQGELIFEEAPFLVIRGKSPDDALLAYCEAGPDVRAACDALFAPEVSEKTVKEDPQIKKCLATALNWARPLQMARVPLKNGRTWPGYLEMARFFLACNMNCHSYGEAGSALYRISSKITHSCDPNSVFRTVGHPEQIAHRALTDIAAGEMITESYLRRSWYSTRSRRAQLLKAKRFKCCCPLCRSPDNSRALPCPECCAPLRASSGRGALSVAAALGKAPAPCVVLDTAAEEAGERACWACAGCGGRFPYAAVCAAMGVEEGREGEVEREIEERNEALEGGGEVPPIREMVSELIGAASVFGPRHWTVLAQWELIGDCAQNTAVLGLDDYISEVAVFAWSYIAWWMVEVARHKPGRVLTAISNKVMAVADAIVGDPKAKRAPGPAPLALARLAASWAIEGFRISLPPKDARRVAAEVTARRVRTDPDLAPQFPHAWKQIDIDVKRISRAEAEVKRKLQHLMTTDIGKFSQLMKSLEMNGQRPR